jgi:hypothetical protein
MKYIKTFSSLKIDDLENYKYFVINPNLGYEERYFVVKYFNDNRKFSPFYNNGLWFDKIYTLYPNKKIKRNKNQKYNMNTEDFKKSIIYKTNNKKDAYDVLASIYDTKKFNL